MIRILTVCGNGIGSSNLLAMKINQVAKKNGIEVEARSCDLNAASGEDPDLFVTVDEFAKQLPKGKRIATVRSYADKKKITEDILPILKELTE